MCKFYCGLDSLFMSVSINILVIMCSDRFLAIKRPFRTTCSNLLRRAIFKVAIALFVSTVITSPMFFLSHAVRIKYRPGKLSSNTQGNFESSQGNNISSGLITPGANITDGGLLFTPGFNQNRTGAEQFFLGTTNDSLFLGHLGGSNQNQIDTISNNSTTQYHPNYGNPQGYNENIDKYINQHDHPGASIRTEREFNLYPDTSDADGNNNSPFGINKWGNIMANLTTTILPNLGAPVEEIDDGDSDNSDYEDRKEVLRCYIKPPDDWQRIYFVFQYLSIFVIPGILLTWLYLEMLREFRTVTSVLYDTQNDTVKIENDDLAETSNNQASQTVNDRMIQLNLSRKRKVTRIILLIIVLFMVCYLPFSTLVLIQMFFKSIPWQKSWFKAVHFIFVTLTYVNSCANPFLYTLLCKRYRIIFIKYFPCRTVNCYCLLPATSDPTPTSIKKRRENLVYSARKRAARPAMNNPRMQMIYQQPIAETPIAKSASGERKNPIPTPLDDTLRRAVVDPNQQFHVIAIYRPKADDEI